MISEKIKAEYRKAFEQGEKWKAEDNPAAQERRRLRNLIALIEKNILPICDSDFYFKANVLKDLGNLYVMLDMAEESCTNLRKAVRIFSRVFLIFRTLFIDCFN